MRRQPHVARANRHSKPLPRMPELPEERLHELVQETDDPLLLILDQVTDPHNLGACLRAADGAGVTAVVVPRRNAVSMNETVRRVACGAADSVPLARVGNLARDELVRIPMAGHVECLNVAVATGVCLFEASRQRRFTDSFA